MQQQQNRDRRTQYQPDPAVRKSADELVEGQGGVAVPQVQDQELASVNDDLSQSQWKQVSDQIKIWWSKIDDEDLERIGGNAERLAGILQQEYGYIKQHAESQSIRWMRKHRTGEQPIEE